MKNKKETIQNIFIIMGFGTIIFIIMLIIDNGFNETLKSIVIWMLAPLFYGLSFIILKMKSKIRIVIHVIVCFLITIIARLLYSYIVNGFINILKTTIITIPIFVGVYVILYIFMKRFGNISNER